MLKIAVSFKRELEMLIRLVLNYYTKYYFYDAGEI